ncbi:helix-turn-helix domain-containing protein [Psychrobacter pygoscelis]|uniref:helix-turn-helix domain-containing protein n=1 Tax=Psychrobacter pygoscelis TaxID=2488563 RepID=UPI00103A50B4|nr:helix-turn-helix domain-containing protein [Psychrobacter pygoscelis]
MLNYEQYPVLKSFTQCDDGSWHPEDIKAAVRKTGVTLAELCRAAGIASNSASKALIEPSTKGEVVIAEHLNIPVQLLFPTRWTTDGKRVRPRYADKYTTVAEMLS